MPDYAAQEFEPKKLTIRNYGIKGVNYYQHASDIADNEFSDTLNLQYYQGNVRADSGYTAFRQGGQFSTVTGGILGQPQGVFQFVETTGVVQTLLLTATSLYKDNGINWGFVGDGVFATTTNGTQSAGNNTIVLTSVTGLNVNDYLNITLNDGSALNCKVSNINVLTVTFGPVVPATKSILNGATVVRAPLLAGNITTFQPQAVTWAPTNKCYITNGVDPLKVYDGASLISAPGTPFTSCRTIAAFHGFLLAMDVTEGGNRLPFRARHCNQGDPTNWSTGLAGFVDLVDTEDFILAAEPLGPWVIIYRDSSIMRRSYVGDPLQPFFDEYMVQGVGMASGSSVADTGATHVIFGEEGIFRYAGGYDLEDVGEKLFEHVLGINGNFAPSQQATVFAFYVAELDEVWIFYTSTSSSDTLPDMLIRYDQGNEGWWIRQFANHMNGFGFLEAAGGRTWLQATGTWAADTTTWTSRSKTAIAPITLLCDPNNYQVWVYDYLSTTDGGTTINWKFTSKSFFEPEYFLRFDGLVVNGQGNGIVVDVSTDDGVSWQNLGTMNFGVSPTVQKLNAQFVAEKFMFRFSGSDPNFQIDALRADYFKESPW